MRCTSAWFACALSSRPKGSFDAALKRPLPAHPRAVGVITSLARAALHDVATTLARRSPHVPVVVYPSVVQGVHAPAALCAAIALGGRRNEVDFLIVCRCGGSIEDLWAFNDERVVRAMRAAPMHVVSGVGHETEVTLADLVADLRAPTPTAAASWSHPRQRPISSSWRGSNRRRRGAAVQRSRRRRSGSIAWPCALPARANRSLAALTPSTCSRSDCPPRGGASCSRAGRKPTRPQLAFVTRMR